MTEHSRSRVFCAAVAGVIFLLPIFAGATEKDQGKRKSWYEQKAVQQKLGLTADQVAGITEVEESFGARLVKMNQEKRTSYRGLMSALDAGQLSEDDFEARRTRLEEAYGSHAAVSADRWRALRSILTKDQWRNLPEVAPRALALGYFSIVKRGSVYMGPKGPPAAPTSKTEDD